MGACVPSPSYSEDIIEFLSVARALLGEPRRARDETRNVSHNAPLIDFYGSLKTNIGAVVIFVRNRSLVGLDCSPVESDVDGTTQDARVGAPRDTSRGDLALPCRLDSHSPRLRITSLPGEMRGDVRERAALSRVLCHTLLHCTTAPPDRIHSNLNTSSNRKLYSTLPNCNNCSTQ